MERYENIVKAKNQVIDVDVKNLTKENLGKICEIMLDKVSGRVAYIVLESGSFLGMGGKLFAIPWNAIHYDLNEDCFILNLDKEKLKNAPGFDKDHWPDVADRSWGETIAQYYSPSNYRQ